MDDDKIIPQEIQPETIAVETPTVEEAPQEMITPEVTSPPPTDDLPPPIYEENKNQYMLIVAGGIVFLIILVIIFKALFFGKPANKAANLIYWGLWEDKEVIEPLIAAYQQKNPHIKITYQKMNPQSYREKLVSRSKAQGTETAAIEKPDIFRFHNTWLPEIKDIVAPLPPTVMSGEEFDKTFYPIHKKDLKVGNYYYGLPLEIDGLVLVYNQSLFKKAGIATVPITWDDITQIVPKLTVKDRSGNLITSGIALGTASNVDHFSDIFGLLLLQNGGSLNKLDREEAAGALEIFRKFSEPPQGYWNEGMPNSTTAFIQEKVAMIIVPSWEVLSIKSANPDIDMKVVPVPVVPGTALISIASYWVEGVSRFSNNQLEAWKFLRFLTEKENMTKLYEIASKTRPFGEPYSRVDLAPLLVQNEYIGAVIKQANNFVTLPLISRTYDNGLNEETIPYLENAINSTIQGVSYKEALGEAKKGIDQVFTKYNISN
ncbi:MAG: Multiple sugar transport system substrate-binding protein [Candidatus Roizmanbacteria bacterium GW2011_GWA2_34_18]|uniref:Multiple sugar transport system substrate-binding protein n=1 Tax=Candidatus Roizmanbacteria bacterium GW2011_GWA2_34_18 TaxID=1618477 RepID=A0A0G0DD67_9BACT|nr:MAG: Multiple sugar transport system substrate-binding protein [Candidatus Roizmanbacteria bacterium GW2011_GWA2_34_18]